MKQLLASIFIFCSCALCAQTRERPSQHSLVIEIPLIMEDSVLNLNASPVLAPGIHRLRQDGMPCVVPDTRDIAVIPNSWKGRVVPYYHSGTAPIPNPQQQQQKVFLLGKKQPQE
jgi:hypothetical protein